MEHSIDTVKQTPDILPLSSVTKTYRLPEGMSLGPDESVKVKGFIARGRIDGKSAVLALDDSGENDTQGSVLQSHLEDVIFGDFSFMRSAYYNHIAQRQGMTTPNILKVSEDDQESLKLTGLSMVSATGSLKMIEQKQDSPAGLVVSRGDELKEVADIEHRAEEIGLYSRATIQFPGDEQGEKEDCIILTDAVGNRIIMPSQEKTTDLLERLFGYQEAEEQLFDAEVALSAMSK
jgi:hypothetical protein